MKKHLLLTAIFAILFCSIRAQDNEPSNNICSNSLDTGTLSTSNTQLSFTNCQLVPHSDQDYKKITLKTGGVLLATIPASVADYNFKIFVSDSATNTPLSGIAGYKNTPFTTATYLNAGTYCVMVQQNTGIWYENKTDTNRYILNLELDTSDKYEVNQVPAEAKEVPYCSSIIGKIRGINNTYKNINTVADRDHYKIKTTKKGILTAYIPVNNTNLSYVTSLLDFNSNSVTSMTSPTPGAASIFQHEIYAGEWYLRVRERDNYKTSDKPYELQICLDTNNSNSDNIPLSYCDTILANTRGGSDTDYYSLSNVNVNTKVQLYNISPALAMKINAYDNMDNLVGTSVSSTQGQATLNYNNLPMNTAYISVEETNGNGVISDYNIALTDPTCVTSVNHINENQTVKIYPNPTSGLFTVENIASQSTLEVYNLIGQKLKVLKGNTGNISVDIHDFPDGTYYLRIENEKGNQYKKLIKY